MKTITYHLSIALFMFLFPLHLHAFWGFTDYSQLSPAQTIEMLEKQQASDPVDPRINYNLGVAYYKNKAFNKAAVCFNRVVAHIADGEILKKQSLFNAATATLNKSKASLPPSWERPDVEVDDAILDAAIKDCQEAIDGYQKLIELEPLHDKAATNKKYAQDVLRKLQEKKKQQQQKQKDKKDDKQKNDKNQDNKDKKNQDNQQQQGQDQDKDNNKDQQKNNQDQKQNQNKDQNKEGDKKQQQDKQKQDENQNKENEQQQNQNKKDEQQRKDNANQGGDKDKQKQDEKKSQDQQPNPQQGKEKQEQQAGAGQEKQQQGNEQQQMSAMGMQTEEQRAAEALLKQIGKEEGKAQREMLLKKIAQPKGHDSNTQKPW